MKVEIKETHNKLIYSKKEFVQRVVLIAIICETFKRLAHFVPEWQKVIQPQRLNHFVLGLKSMEIVPNDSYWFKTPYNLTFSI